MRAARYWGKEDIRVEDVPVPEIGPGEALIKVGYAGICGSDMWITAERIHGLRHPSS